MHKCHSIDSYTINITDPAGEQLYYVTNATAGNISIGYALPFTNYSVTIEAVNDAKLMNKKEKYLVTTETSESYHLFFTQNVAIFFNFIISYTCKHRFVTI